MLSAIHKNVQHIFSFARSTELGSDTAKFEKRSCLIMLSEVHHNVQKNFSFAVGTRLSNEIAKTSCLCSLDLDPESINSLSWSPDFAASF